MKDYAFQFMIWKFGNDIITIDVDDILNYYIAINMWCEGSQLSVSI